MAEAWQRPPMSDRESERSQAVQRGSRTLSEVSDMSHQSDISDGDGDFKREVRVDQAKRRASLLPDLVVSEKVLHPDEGEVCLDDFNILSQLGEGGFGKVVLARKKTTGTMHAIKAVRKEKLLTAGQVLPPRPSPHGNLT